MYWVQIRPGKSANSNRIHPNVTLHTLDTSTSARPGPKKTAADRCESATNRNFNIVEKTTHDSYNQFVPFYRADIQTWKVTGNLSLKRSVFPALAVILHNSVSSTPNQAAAGKISALIMYQRPGR